MTPEEKNHILDIIQDSITDLLKDEDDILFAGGGGCQNYLDDVYEFIKDYHPEVDWINNGVSKIVISYNDLPNYVIKIPFKGKYDEYNDENAFFINADCYEKPYENVNTWDYCESEANCYYDAEKYYGLGDMFAKTEYLGEIENTPVYISEKITILMSDTKVKNSNKHTEKIAKTLQSKYEIDYSFCEGDGLLAFINCYGEERTEDLVSFLEEYGIEDLHNGNIGYDLYGNVKIIDYSGWYD